jgi:multidrug resistance efflux pump
MALPQHHAKRIEPLRELRLPPFEDRPLPGGLFVRRAVPITLGVFSMLVALALIIGSILKINVTVDGSGVLEQARVWPVRSTAAGTVAEVLVRPGDSVRMGQVVVRIHNAARTEFAMLRAQIDAARLLLARGDSLRPYERSDLEDQIVRCEAQVARARAQLRQRLLEYGLSTNVDSVVAAYRTGTHNGLDPAVADLKVALADARSARSRLEREVIASLDQERDYIELRRLEAEFKEVSARVARTLVRAPTFGLVLTDELERLVGSVVQEGQTLLEIADTTGWRVAFSVPEQGVYRIRKGDRVAFELPALSGVGRDRLTGQVAFVGAHPMGAGISDPPAGASGGGYHVIASVDVPASDSLLRTSLRRGYVVRARVVTQSERLIVLLRNRIMNVRGQAR